MRLAILGSTRGSTVLPLIEAFKQNKLHAEIALVISNKKSAGILALASHYGLTAQFLPLANLSREDYDQIISNLCQQYAIDLIVLIGYMRILSQPFVNQWQNKIINVHPSLLPAFANKMDIAVHQAVLQAKVKETGCTVHYVTAEVDAGPIILQKKCPVLENDTPLLLKQRVQRLEAACLIEVINNFAPAI